MNIYEFAKTFETESRQYYQKLADQTVNPGLKNILEMLAKAESRHLEIIQSLEQEDTFSTSSEIDILADAKSIFISMKDQEQRISDEMSQIQLYKKALEKERNSHAFYLDKSDSLEPGHARDILFMLAGEEKKHAFLVANIIEFIQRPQTWIEDAEFYHLDEY